MELLVWIGAAITVLGLGGIVWSVVKVLAIRREAPPDEELRTRLQKLVPLNLGAFFLSMLGLMCVVIGVILS